MPIIYHDNKHFINKELFPKINFILYKKQKIKFHLLVSLTL